MFIRNYSATCHERKLIRSFEQIAWNQSTKLPSQKKTAASIDPDNSDIRLSDINVTVEDRDALTQITEQLQDLLPAVTAHLSEHNRLEEWVARFNLINAGDFDVDHIASQLFWDVVKSAQVRNVHSMRFSPAVKRFWRSGCPYFMQNLYVYGRI